GGKRDAELGIAELKIGFDRPGRSREIYPINIKNEVHDAEDEQEIPGRPTAQRQHGFPSQTN
ncbi:MAG TPA: hypothetical protein VM782_15135, partial [Stellaceae bacterium]|nr:hypothetical protein [Stellaceae bacterium]